MKQKKLEIGAGAVLFAALLYYLGGGAVLAALLLPAAVHELGHLAALKLLGLKVRSFRLTLKGFCIEYGGYTGAMGHALAAACGPMAGLWFAWGASWLGNRLDKPWLCLTAGVSLLLSAFNLLPALPLDGGRILSCLSAALLGEKRGGLLTRWASLAVGALLLSAGVWQMLHGRGAALTLAAVWLLLYQDERGLVNGREVL